MDVTRQAVFDTIGRRQDFDRMARVVDKIRSNRKFVSDLNRSGWEFQKQMLAFRMFEITRFGGQKSDLRKDTGKTISESFFRNQIQITRSVKPDRVNRHDTPADKNRADAIRFQMGSHMPPKFFFGAGLPVRSFHEFDLLT